MFIKIYINAFDNEQPPEIYETNNLSEWLFEHYGEVPSRPLDLFRGEPSPKTCITGDIPAIRNAAEGLYTIVERPAEPATIAGIQLFIAAFSTVLSIASAANPDIVMPANVNRAQQSQNNSLGDRSNQNRIYQRVEDIYGEVLSIPTLMMPTWKYFSTEGDLFERGYYCGGRGYYDIAKAVATAKDGDTDLSAIPKCRAAFYNPFTIPDNTTTTPVAIIGAGIFEAVDTRIENANTTDIALPAINQESLFGRHGYAFYGNKIIQAVQSPPFGDVLIIGQNVDVTMPYDYGSANAYNPTADTFPSPSWLPSIASGSPIDGHSDSSGSKNGSADGVLQSGVTTGIYQDASGVYNWYSLTYTSSLSAKTIAITDRSAVAKITSDVLEAQRPGVAATASIVVGDIIRGLFNGIYYRRKITAISVSGSIRTFTLDTGIPNATAQSCEFGIFVNYTGLYTITDISFDYPGFDPFVAQFSIVTVSGSPFTRQVIEPQYGSFIDENWALVGGEWSSINRFINATVVPPGVAPDGYTQYFKFTNINQTKIQVNISAPQGLYKQALGTPTNLSVVVQFTVQQLVAGVGTGTEYTTTLTIHSHTPGQSQATGATLVIDLQSLCGFVGACQIKAKRLTLHDYEYQGTVVDEVRWATTYVIVPSTKSHFGNKFTMLTDVQLNQKALSSRNRQLNLILSRLLPTWNGSTWSATLGANGALTSGTLNPTKNPVDIIAEITRDRRIGNRPVTDVDIDQINSVITQINTWNTNCGQFSYTFDSDATTYEQHIQIIANAVFSVAYRQNSKLRFAFDGPQPISTGLVTYRSKKPGAMDSLSRNFFEDTAFDGVQMVYPDPDTLKTETFYLPLDGSFNKVQKIELPGIRNFTQAWFRANREYQRLFNQRVSIHTEMTMEARAFVPNCRVDIVDNTRFKSYSGEVLGLAGLVLTLSDDVVFKSGHTHTIVLAQRDGTPESISCTVGTVANQVILAQAPLEIPVVISGIDGIRTIYSFAADDDRAAMAYRVKTVDYSQPPYAIVEAVNYSAADYTADTLTVPSRSDIVGA